MIALGLGTLRLTPAAFWAMTPLELAIAAEGVLGPKMTTPPRRADLDRLMAAFPDRG